MGGIAFLVDIGLLFILTKYIHQYYLISAVISFASGLIVSFFLNKKWIFTESTVKNKYLEFVAFATIGLIGLVINEMLIWYITEKMNVYYLYSKILAAAVIYILNFLGRKYLIYS